MQNSVIDNILIVLVGTTHPGNIGATARAMKTMGIKRLHLVNPKIFPSAEVTARAAGADDILATAVVHPSLEAAVRDCALVLATSGRSRNIPWPVMDPGQAASEAVGCAGRGAGVAMVFGRESSGLTNEELELCHAMVRIPTNPAYSSLNVAAAVQLICYELHKAMPQKERLEPRDEALVPLVTVEQMEQLYEHLRTCMAELGYYDPEKPRLLMRRLKRLFNRARLDLNEYSILRGILAAAQEKARKADAESTQGD